MKSSLSLLLLSTASTSTCVFGDSLRGTALSDCINKCHNTSYKSSYDSYHRLCEQWCNTNCNPSNPTSCDPPTDVEDFNFNLQSLAGTVVEDQPQCYNLGESCETHSDCWQGGTNMCTRCGTKHGTEYYKRCYGGERRPPPPTPKPPVQCYNLGDPCDKDSDCRQGGTNMCTKCGSKHGTQYYKRCYGGDYEEEEDKVLEFVESDEDGPPRRNSDAEQLNHNLQSLAGITVQGPSNKHQCYNHCDRHNSWDSEEIEQCKADCDEQYDPPQCYNLGDSCQTDSDCWQGGTNMCTKCGTQHGTQYYKRCYGGETPFPTPSPVEPIQCYNLGESCEQDSDCWQGGTNMCTRCGNTHGTQYYKRCYGEEMNEDGDYAVLEFDESGEDGPTWDDIKNRTKRAARKTADGAKNAADKTKEWGQKTFDPSSGYAKSSALFVAMGAVVQAFFV